MLQVAKQEDLISSAESEEGVQAEGCLPWAIGVTQDTWAGGWQPHEDSVPGGDGQRAGILD